MPEHQAPGVAPQGARIQLSLSCVTPYKALFTPYPMLRRAHRGYEGLTKTSFPEELGAETFALTGVFFRIALRLTTIQETL